MRQLINYYIQRLKNYLWHLPRSIFFNLLYNFPQKKLILIGITGTDGKTTTATLIHQTLIDAGIKSDLITTINSPGLHTTSPDPAVLIPLFSSMVKSGITHAVVETTAHGLDQFRFWGCKFEIGILTNISHEHLDDFINLEKYTKTKTILFQNSKISILNQDDSSYQKIRPKLSGKVISYGIKTKSDFQASDIKITKNKLMFTINQYTISTNSPYYYQIYNILASFCAIQSLTIEPKIFLNTVTKFPETKGRREIISNNLGLTTIIDFAHTPQALKATLESLKIYSKGKIIVIFGATGGRDPSKRPIMGKVVSQNSDVGIITADDTRNELVENINQQIISGIDPNQIKLKKFQYYNIPNRQDAFNLAVKIAKPNDTIIACGKGHETSILHRQTEYPWSEAEAFRTAFRSKENV